MSDIADKIYASTGLTLGAEAAAAIGRLIQVENEKLRAKQADRIAELEAALATARREGMEDAAKIADGYHQRAIAWAKTVRGLDKHIDETDSSRIAATIRAALGEKP
jgi:hypothetical protein